jgi:hypothetical protein
VPRTGDAPFAHHTFQTPHALEIATTEDSLTRSLATMLELLDGVGQNRDVRRRCARTSARSPGLDGAAGSSDDACCEREDALHGVLLLGVLVPRTSTTISWYLSGSHTGFPGEVERVSRRKMRFLR